MKNKHISILPNKIKFKNKILLDLTFGCGGYIKNIIKDIILKKIYTIDISSFSYYMSKNVFKKNFFFFKLKIKNFYFLIKRFNLEKFDLIFCDQGLNSLEIKKKYFNFKKKKYFKIKKELNFLNLFFFFFEIIKNFKKKFKLIILTFNLYEHYKITLFLKKIKKFKIKIIKPNKFEMSLNIGMKNAIIHLIYV